ncbi:MAG: hypothetical protein ACRYFU_12085 [Janthinobacterium lividum]
MQTSVLRTTTEEHWRNFGGDYPLVRAGQPAELASIYVQLAAQGASHITGNIYGAGGGSVTMATA